MAPDGAGWDNGPMTGEAEKRAATAVVASLRVSQARRLREATGTKTHAAAVTAVATAMRDGSMHNRTLPFWNASGRDLFGALEDLTGFDEGMASHMVGAALHALLMAGEDVRTDLVLALAERAVAYDRGLNLSHVDVPASSPAQ